MINQPWKSKNWFTSDYGSAKPFKSKSFSYGQMQSKGVVYMANETTTINLNDVLEWTIVPSERRRGEEHPIHSKNGLKKPELCKVKLTEGREIVFVSGIIPRDYRRDNDGKLVYTDRTAPITVDQITEFFDAMREAKLL